MPRLSAFVLHATAAVIMTWGWLSLLDRLKENPPATVTQKGGYYQFLTNQGLFATWACMVASLFCDVFSSVAVVRHVKRTLLMISLPMEFIISSIYWSLIWFCPRLILPPSKLPLPLPIDLALHALPLLILLIDFFVFERKFSKAHVYKVAPAAVVLFSIWYASFVEYCATFNGSFPYPFLTHNPFAIRVLIYTTTTGIALGCFRMLNALHA